MIIRIKSGDCEIYFEQEEELTVYNPVCSGKTHVDGGLRDNSTFIQTLKTMVDSVKCLHEASEDKL